MKINEVKENKWYVVNITYYTKIEGLQKCHFNHYKEVTYMHDKLGSYFSSQYKTLIKGSGVKNYFASTKLSVESKVNYLWDPKAKTFSESIYASGWTYNKPVFYQKPKISSYIIYQGISDAEDYCYTDLQNISTVEEFARFKQFIDKKIKEN